MINSDSNLSKSHHLQEALAPYQHIEQDLKSLKEVVEMKNQQIHQQEKKISDLEKVVGSIKLPTHTHVHTHINIELETHYGHL